MLSKRLGALIGCGYIAEHGHLPAFATLADQCQIVAVADICAARRDRMRALLPRARVYSDAATLLANERDIAFVDIATPPRDHAPLTHMALERGLNVYCEKPIATSASEVHAVREHAKRAKRLVYPSHNYKHAPVIKQIRAALDAGLIGDLRLVTLETFRTTHARGTPEWQPDWRRHREVSGGGITMDHGSHTFYLAFDWFGARPTSVIANMSSSGAYDTEDTTSCTLTFPSGGIAMAHLTWNAGFRKVIYTLHGTRGAIKAEDDLVEIHRQGEVSIATAPSNWMDSSHVTWFSDVFRKFFAAMAGEAHYSAELDDAVCCIETIDAAYASAARRPLPPTPETTENKKL